MNTLFPLPAPKSPLHDQTESILNLLVLATRQPITPVSVFSQGDGWAVFTVVVKSFNSTETRTTYDVKIIVGQEIEARELAVLKLAFEQYLSEYGWEISPNLASIKLVETRYLPNYVEEQPVVKMKETVTLSQDSREISEGSRFRSYVLERLLHFFHMTYAYYSERARAKAGVGSSDAAHLEIISGLLREARGVN